MGIEKLSSFHFTKYFVTGEEENNKNKKIMFATENINPPEDSFEKSKINLSKSTAENFKICDTAIHGLDQAVYNIDQKFANSAGDIGILVKANRKLKTKGLNIKNNAHSQIISLQQNIESLLKNNSLTEEELNEQVTVLLEKQKAIIENAEKKMEILTAISDQLYAMSDAIFNLRKDQKAQNELMAPINKLIESFDDSALNLSSANNKEDINKLKKDDINNVLGKDSDKKLSKQIKDLKEKIEENENKLKDKTLYEQEKKLLNTKAEVYKMQIEMLKEISSSISASVSKK